jgi:antitoxin component YwqK of YwqJK toxin-antitoxin module
MINKHELQSIISKYHLNGMIEPVKWDIKDKELIIKFNAPTKDMIGKVIYKNIPLEDSTIAISNTSQLNKLIGITNGYLELSYTKINKFITKLIIADNQFTLNYALADTMIIPKAGELNDAGEWNVEAVLDNESIGAIVKAKSALAESETVVIKPHENADGEFQIEMQFGGNIEHANKVSFYISNASSHNISDDFKEYYNSGMIKEIMYCNKDMATGTIKINMDGIMELTFENDNLKSIYYVIAKEV